MKAPVNPYTGEPLLYGRRSGRTLKANQQSRLDIGLERWGLEIEAIDEASDLNQLFPKPAKEHWLEIGFGGGENLAKQVKLYPDVGHIGVEFFENGVSLACKHLLEVDQDNVRLVHGDGRLVLDALPEQSLSKVFILHPDPWPKKRHHFRRIVNFEVLDRLEILMKPGAELRLATDHPSYKPWMLQKILDHPAFEWLATGKSDWETYPADWPQTRYAAKAVAEGRPPMNLICRRV